MPPVVVVEAELLHNPKHVAFTPDAVETMATGCVIVTLAVSVQPLASVTVTIKLPAQSPVAVTLVWNKGSFHE